MGVIGRWGGLAASSDTPEKAADVVDRMGSFGTGKSAALLVLASGLSMKRALTSSSLVDAIESDIFMFLC